MNRPLDTALFIITITLTCIFPAILWMSIHPDLILSHFSWHTTFSISSPHFTFWVWPHPGKTASIRSGQGPHSLKQDNLHLCSWGQFGLTFPHVFLHLNSSCLGSQEWQDIWHVCPHSSLALHGAVHPPSGNFWRIEDNQENLKWYHLFIFRMLLALKQNPISNHLFPVNIGHYVVPQSGLGTELAEVPNTV